MLVLSNWPQASALVIALSISPLSAHAQSKDSALAREHFDSGVTAFDQKRFGDAISEFRAAYALSPVFSVLYNIGQVSVALGDSVGAVEAFEQYLQHGGSNIGAERRSAVLGEIARQKALIGTVTIRTRPEGAEVMVDGRVVGRTPLTNAIRLSRGRHSVVSLLNGYETQAREIDVSPGSALELSVDLAPEAAGPAPSESQAMPEPPASTGPHTTINVAVSQPVQAQPLTPAPSRMTEVTEPAPQLGTLRAASYVVGGLGVALGAIGTYLCITGASQATDGKDQMNGAVSGTAWDAGQADYDNGKTRNQLGWIGIATGTLALSAGVILYVVSDSSRSGKSAVQQRVFALGASQRAGGDFITATATW